MCFNLRDLKKVIFFQVNVALTLIKDDTFITSTWKRLAGGGVKFARCLRVLWFLNNRSVFEMKGRWGGHKIALPEKCPNTEFFLVRNFPHLGGIRRDTEYLSVFSPNARKYGPEKTPYLDTFHALFVFFFFCCCCFFAGVINV